MQKKFERGSEEAQMMVDMIHLIQNHYIVEKTDEYMDNFMKDMYEFAAKYKGVNEKLSQCLGLAMLDYIEEVRRNMK